MTVLECPLSSVSLTVTRPVAWIARPAVLKRSTLTLTARRAGLAGRDEAEVTVGAAEPHSPAPTKSAQYPLAMIVRLLPRRRLVGLGPGGGRPEL